MNTPEPLCIVIVDDDDNFCRSLGRLLRAAGMRSVAFSSAEAFLAEGEHLPLDCLVLDVQLTGMSGIELGRRLRAEGRSVPFICITGHDDPELRTTAETAGCAAFFRKTDPGAAVLDAIRRAAR